MKTDKQQPKVRYVRVDLNTWIEVKGNVSDKKAIERYNKIQAEKKNTL